MVGKLLHLCMAMGLLCCMSVKVHAQDVIHRINETTIKAKILSVGEESITYIKWNNLEGPSYSIGIDQIKYIIYQNGTTDYLTEQKSVLRKKIESVASESNKSSYNTLIAEAESLESSAKTIVNVGATITSIIGVGTGVGLMLITDNKWLGGGVMLGTIVLGIIIVNDMTSPKMEAAESLRKRAENLAIVPVVQYDQYTQAMAYGAGITLRF